MIDSYYLIHMIIEIMKSQIDFVINSGVDLQNNNRIGLLKVLNWLTQFL